MKDIESHIKKITDEKQKMISQLGLFDASIWIGKQNLFPLAEELKINDLPFYLKEFSISGAMVSHWDGIFLSAQDGNEALISCSEKLPENVFTVWTGLPLIPDEPPPLPGLAKLNAKLRGIRLFPKSHNFTFSRWTLSELCDWCIEYRIPIFIWHTEIDWNSLYTFLQNYPEIKVVLETQWQKILYHNRDLYSLMKYNKNLFIEISNLVGQDSLTYTVRRFGAERLIFGSFLPVNDPLVSIGMLIDAEIKIEDKKRIAGENLLKIIEDVKL